MFPGEVELALNSVKSWLSKKLPERRGRRRRMMGSRRMGRRRRGRVRRMEDEETEMLPPKNS